MTLFDHLDIAAAIVSAVSVVIACRKLPWPLLWPIGFVTFCVSGLVFSWGSSRNQASPPEKPCFYRETQTALIVECPIPRKGSP